MRKSPSHAQTGAVLKFAVREMRALFQNFKIFFASLFLGTVIMAGVGSVTANISDSIKQDGQILLGGDVEIGQTQQPLEDKALTYIAEFGDLSEIANLRSMLHAENDSSLVDLKVIDQAYPLYGELSLMGQKYSYDILARKSEGYGILLSDALAARLNLTVGGMVRLGTEIYQVRGIIKKEPDATTQGFQLAPSAFISRSSLSENDLIQPGSLVRYYYRIKLNQNISNTIFINAIKMTFPENGWQIRDSSSGGAGLIRFIDRMGQFMTLVGLTALLIGGVGVSNAVRTYLSRKTNTIAIYKILGGTGRTILWIYLMQILMVAAAAIMLGLMVGAILPIMAGGILKDSLPLELSITFYAKPLLLAAFYSFTIAVIFTLWPLGQAMQTPAAHLFRQMVNEKKQLNPPFVYGLVIFMLAALFISVVIYMSEYRMLAAMTLGAAMGAFLILYGLAFVVKHIARKFLQRTKTILRPIFKITLSNIYRPGNSTTSIMISLGLGLILFTTIGLVENNLTRDITGRINNEAPSFFFIDLQKSQQDDFMDFMENHKGIEAYRMVPNLRGRITHVKAIESSKVQVSPEGEWILRGDRGLSFSPTLPSDNVIVAGTWWPQNYAGRPEISISEQMATSMMLTIGDEITVNILGRNFSLPISSVRRFSWENFGINYVMMLDPSTLKSAPFTYVATAKVKTSEEDFIYQKLYEKFPNVSIVRMKDILSDTMALFHKISLAIDILAAITISSGILVLAGAIAAGHRARLYDAAILKVIGATRLDILAAYVLEFIVLGFAVGVAAIVMGTLAAYSIVKFMMELSWSMPFDVPLMTVSASIAMTLLFGAGSIWFSMSVRPSQILRNP